MRNAGKKIAYVYVGLLFLFTAAGLLLAASILSLSYDQLISWVLREIQKPELDSLIRQKTLSPDKFRLLRTLALIAMAGLPLLAFFLYRVRKRVIYWIWLTVITILNGLKGIYRLFRSHSKTEKTTLLIVLAFFVCRSLYYIAIADLQYDEMWSYNYFTTPPFYFPICMYNNYPLYSLSTHLLKWLPVSGKIIIRFPVMIMGLLSAAVLYFYLYRTFRRQLPAIIGMIFLAFMPVTTIYSLYGRGILFELFFAIIAAFSLFDWMDDPKQTGKLAVFIIAQVLGLYSMPTHIYFCICLFVLFFFQFREHRKSTGKFIVANILFILGGALCYLPVLLGSGISFLTDNLTKTLTLTESWLNMPWVNFQDAYFVSGSEYGLIAVAIGCVILLLVNKRGPRRFPPGLIYLSLLLIALPPVQLLTQGFQVLYRALSFICLSIPLTVSTLIYRFVSRPRPWLSITLAGCSLLFAISISSSHSSFVWSRVADRHVKELSSVFLKSGVTNYYDSSAGSFFFYYYPGIEYYYRRAGKQIRLATNDTNSLRYKPFSGSDHYDCIIYFYDSSRSDLPRRGTLFSSKTEQFVVVKTDH